MPFLEKAHVQVLVGLVLRDERGDDGAAEEKERDGPPRHRGAPPPGASELRLAPHLPLDELSAVQCPAMCLAQDTAHAPHLCSL